MNFSDFSDGGEGANADYVVGYAAGGGAGSDRKWLRSVLGYMTQENNVMGLRIKQFGYGNVQPIDNDWVGFNEITVFDYTPTNVAAGFVCQVELFGDSGSNWGSANTLTEKIGGEIGILVITKPTGTGPHQPVGLAAGARAAPGIGSLTTVQLFAANFGAQADTPVDGLIGNEYNMIVTAGGSCNFKWGINMVTSGASGGDGNDVAFVTGGDGVAKWKNGFSWFNDSISGTILGPYAGIATMTCVAGIDFSTTTFTGPQIKLALGANMANQVNDAGASGAGVPVGGVYRNGSILMVRVA